MASTQNPAVTLEGLVARTWSLPLTVGRSPRGLSVPVSSTSFYDGQRPEEIREDTVLLAVGVDVDGTDAKEAIRVAGAANAAAIVFKSDGPISETLAAVSDHTGVALLSVGQELAWEEVYSMIHLSLLAPETLIPEFRGDDLTSLATALASVAVFTQPFPLLPMCHVVVWSSVIAWCHAPRRCFVLHPSGYEASRRPGDHCGGNTPIFAAALPHLDRPPLKTADIEFRVFQNFWRMGFDLVGYPFSGPCHRIFACPKLVWTTQSFTVISWPGSVTMKPAAIIWIG